MLDQLAPSNANTVAIVCGPPIMIRLVLPILAKLNFTPEQTFTTLENRTKCGPPKADCGHCNVGKVYVCKDGPVFTLAQLKELPAEY